MIEDLRVYLRLIPFRSFAVRTTFGRTYPVLTIDHIYFPPGGNAVIIADDRGVTVAIPALLIAGFGTVLPSLP